jgi:hypothetical protein
VHFEVLLEGTDVVSTFAGLDWMAGKALQTEVRWQSGIALRIFDRFSEVQPLSACGIIPRVRE